ncbi:Hsp20/alpha crystallin family protein [Quadrisphaera sp. GCM10027208]|uniref:Hsp20/alpha crystallin family protein n=1 Tax=Quadrisphaera sp. GCM10027208 TaxID=3273423 RepID=UPI00360BF418
MALPARRSTELQTWNPFRELDDLHERMSRLMESTFGETRNGLTSWVPAVDIEETDEAFLVEAELPGVKRDDVTVELRDNELTIHGEIKERERTGVLRRQTRRTGQFDYRVVLPGDVDADNVEANLQEGILRVTVRKAEQAKPRRIEITAA